MKNLVIKKGQCVYLHWLDSATYGSGWVYEDIKAVPKHIDSVGFVLKVSPEAVLITSTKSESGGSVAPIAIPTCSIETYKILEFQ